MERQDCNVEDRVRLQDKARIVVIGGGPAGTFFAIHLLRKAKAHEKELEVIILEKHWQRCQPESNFLADNWRGCNSCAGGLSPRLSDALEDLKLEIPEPVIQSRIHSITVQGYWKNIELEVPRGRNMLSVFRGSRPARRLDRRHSLDSFLMDEAVKLGAELRSGEAQCVEYSESGNPIVTYCEAGAKANIEADFVVFAMGVNSSHHAEGEPIFSSLRRLIPNYVPPRLRRALIFELKTDPRFPRPLEGELHFVEYGSPALRLDMCSLVPKRDYLTVVLVGPSVDASLSPAENWNLVWRFLELPHIRKLIPHRSGLRAACVCNPNLVVGSARNPFGYRVAVIGDLATSRLYKDGILSAHRTAQSLAETLLEKGVDARSLERGYGPTVRRFQRDNRFARWVFLLHRIFFSSSILSRLLYQAVITERKFVPGPKRHLEKILWRIASGDDEYENIFRSMMGRAALWSIATGGLLVTLRNWLTEFLFGLRWEGFGRFTTGVARERLEAKRAFFANKMARLEIPIPQNLEFERMYTIKIRAPRGRVMEQLGKFGEESRNYFKPRWVQIRRIHGLPNEPGCVIRYFFVWRRFSFSLVLERVVGENMAVYRIQDGFARGGVLIFEIEHVSDELCSLSIYVAFNFARGRRWFTRLWARLFRSLFPAFVHDVLWNHSLCQLKDIVEADDQNHGSFPSDQAIQQEGG